MRLCASVAGRSNISKLHLSATIHLDVYKLGFYFLPSSFATILYFGSRQDVIKYHTCTKPSNVSSHFFMQHSQKLLLLFSLTLFSCAINDKRQEAKSETQVSSVDTAQQVDTSQKQIVTTKPPSDTDTLTIDTKAAVFFQPDSLQMQKRMKEVGEENFRAADDYIYYVNTSAEYLEKKSLPVIDAKNKKYLKFVMTDKNVQFIKLDTLKELWGMYLFDPKKKPHYADMTVIEDDYKNYFK